MKLDLHVHIRRHHRLEDIRRAVKARGLDGIAVTNFHNISFAKYLRERIEDFLIIVGQEVESKHGHILAINIAEKIPDGLAPEDTIRRIHAQGGVAILAHPYLGWNSISPHGRRQRLPFDAVEAFNYRAGPMLYPKVANTDSKILATIGLCYNEVPVPAASRYSTQVAAELIPEILHCLRKGQIRRHQEWQMPNWNWFRDNVSHLLRPQKYYRCFYCGDKIVFKIIRRTYTCLRCGRQEARHARCVRGHYVCSGCRTRMAFETPEFLAYRAKLEEAAHVE
jgi:predicted metal-dependent phosphoesterase TrpH/DNA-directed RNA polymerase subunit RPC12/RpoP